ncbi:MAG: SprT-like domain-containing protein [Deltaproteobacteria bacterium]|jgi:hypothetical protein|nr:SprT-like domain-containing protein [Deltaproteobacteria bacterium]
MSEPNQKTNRESINVDLKNAWIRRLHEHHRFLLQRLGIEDRRGSKMTVFITIFKNKPFWGFYNPEEFTIGLNLTMFESCPWTTITGILAHETAHQAVYFLSPQAWRAESSHGPTFQKFCQRMGLNPVFAAPGCDEDVMRHPPNPFGPQKKMEPNPILIKVQKLLALSSSPEPAEAEAALAAAGRLMAKHNLEMVNNPSPGQQEYERWVLPLGSLRRTMKSLLIGAIIKCHFFVETITIDHYDHLTNRHQKALEILGRPINLVMAKHVFLFLNERTESLWSYHKPLARRMGEKGIKAKNAFIISLLRSFLDKLNNAESQDSKLPSSAVILASDAGLRDFFDQSYPHRRHSYLQDNSRSSPFSRLAGAKAGQELTINPPIDSHNSGGFGGYINN